MSKTPPVPSPSIPEVPQEVDQFIQLLQELGPGPRARLRRNAGNALSESRGVLPLFFSLLPREVVYPKTVESYFLIATLFGSNPIAGGRGNLAWTLADIANRAGVNKNGVDRRVAILIDSDRDELPFRLRQAVHFVATHRRPINWSLLLWDLLVWEHPNRPVQKAWARTYFGN